MTWKTFFLGVYMWSITALLFYFFPRNMSSNEVKWACLAMFPGMQIMAVIVLTASRK